MLKIVPTENAAKQRARILERVILLRQEIARIFIDSAHWNESVRKPDEQPIDPDPDGMLRRLAAAYDVFLKRHIP